MVKATASGVLRLNGVKFTEMRMIRCYRYISYISTSASYMLGGDGPPARKAAVALFLGVAAFLLDYIYRKHRTNRRLVMFLILLETVGNVAVLLPSGGLQSPYIWYSLNTALASAYFFSPVFLCADILIYVAFSLATVYLLQGERPDIASFLLDNSNLILSYLLIILAIGLLMKLTRVLDRERLNMEKLNGEYSKANKMLAESMTELASLYRNVHAFVNIRNKERLGAIIAEYLGKMTKSPFAFVFTRTSAGDCVLETAAGAENDKDLVPPLKARLNSLPRDGPPPDSVLRETVAGRRLMIAAVRSASCDYGYLGIEMGEGEGEIMDRERVEQLKMLASLSAVLHERLKNEEISQNLLLSEEQRRIAGEIHDGVSQRLFYTLCKLGSLIQQANEGGLAGLADELCTVKDSLRTAAKELRETIYREGFSGAHSFEESVRQYACEIGRLNDVHMEVEVEGDFDYIGLELKKVILRILGEACGNAIRHGKCKNISVRLYKKLERIELEICDDGTGFDLTETANNGGLGMGIRNMNSLVYSFDGSLEINSRLYEGTVVSVLLPLASRSEGVIPI